MTAPKGNGTSVRSLVALGASERAARVLIARSLVVVDPVSGAWILTPIGAQVAEAIENVRKR